MKTNFSLQEMVALALSCLRHRKNNDARAILQSLPDGQRDVQLAWARLIYQEGDNQRAFDMVRPLVESKPDDALAVAFMCFLWAKAGDVVKTQPFLDKLATIKDGPAEYWGNLSEVFFRGKNYAAMEHCARKALALDEEWESQWLMLALAQRENIDPQGAISSAFRALALNPFRGETYLYLHIFFEEMGEFDRSLPFLSLAKENGLNDAKVELSEAHCLLRRGQLTEGFAKYRARYLDKDVSLSKPICQAPYWQGENLAGKNLLVYCEQGFGDVIQFVRYLPDLVGQGAKVTFICRKPLVSLLRTSLPEIEVLDALEEASGFDYQSYLIDLAIYLLPEIARSVARAPYLRADVRKAFDVLNDVSKPKIGFVWHGATQHLRNRYRSMALADIKPLLELDQFAWVSLQHNPKEALGAYPHIYDFVADLKDFADTTALIDKLDLVITVDTSVAHLAAALGKPVWIMLDHCPDWRWMEKETTSYWYASACLFRQEKNAGWSPVVEAMKTELLKAGFSR